MEIKLHDVLRNKDVAVTPWRAEVVVDLDSDGRFVFLTKVISRWTYEEDVTVYFGRCIPKAIEVRLEMLAKIAEAEADAEEQKESAQVREHFAGAKSNNQDQDTMKKPGRQAGGDEGGGETNVRQDNYRQ